MTIKQHTEDERLHYQILIDDIRESKLNQWRISNYGLIAQAAVASVFSSVKRKASSGDACWWDFGPFVVSIIILCTVIFLIWGDRCRIEKNRKETEAYARPFNNQENPLSRRGWPLLGLFFGAQVIGLIMSMIYIFFGT